MMISADRVAHAETGKQCVEFGAQVDKTPVAIVAVHNCYFGPSTTDGYAK